MSELKVSRVKSSEGSLFLVHHQERTALSKVSKLPAACRKQLGAFFSEALETSLTANNKALAVTCAKSLQNVPSLAKGNISVGNSSDHTTSFGPIEMIHGYFIPKLVQGIRQYFHLSNNQPCLNDALALIETNLLKSVIPQALRMFTSGDTTADILKSSVDQTFKAAAVDSYSEAKVTGDVLDIDLLFKATLDKNSLIAPMTEVISAQQLTDSLQKLQPEVNKFLFEWLENAWTERAEDPHFTDHKKLNVGANPFIVSLENSRSGRHEVFVRLVLTLVSERGFAEIKTRIESCVSGLICRALTFELEITGRYNVRAGQDVTADGRNKTTFLAQLHENGVAAEPSSHNLKSPSVKIIH